MAVRRLNLTPSAMYLSIGNHTMKKTLTPWAKQVGQRAIRLAEIMRTGEFLK